MTAARTTLCLDLGAASLKLGQFAWDETGALRLMHLAIEPRETSSEVSPDRDAGPDRTVGPFLSRHRRRARHCSLCAPASTLFTKFLRLPAVERSRRDQVLEFEVRQNFPLAPEELTWDSEIIEAAATGQEEILLTAVKSATAQTWLEAAEQAGCQVDVLDAAPAALANAFRYNYSDLPGCSMVLDIGARSSTLLFVEEKRLFFRTINLGHRQITAEFAAEAKLPFKEAERRKLAEGMVGLGGAYEEPAAADQAVLAKIARQFMTRLHAQVAQTMQFHRLKQEGSPPQRLYLAGAGSSLPYTAPFFAEKLNLPVEPFNPLRHVGVDPSIPLDSLARVAPALGGLVGLALRAPMQCPLELNLIPAPVLRRRRRRRASAYLGAALSGVAAALLAVGWCYDQIASDKRAILEAERPLVQRLQERELELKHALAQRDRSARTAQQLASWMSHRFYWADLLEDLRRVLVATESSTSRGAIRTGIWIETMGPELPDEPTVEEPATRPFLDPRLWRRYFGSLPGLPPGWNPELATLPSGAGPIESNPTPRQPDVSATNRIQTIQLTCRALSWKRVSPTADSELAIAFLRELQASGFSASGTNGTCLSGLMQQDEATGTFSFTAKLVLKDPIAL